MQIEPSTDIRYQAVAHPGVEDYARLLRNRTPFAQANYGDGEWGCMLGKQGQNVNGEVYTDALASRLRRTLLEPRDYWYGTNPGDKWKKRVRTWLRSHEVEVRWVWKDVLSGANVRGELGPVLDVLRERDTILVGPPHLRDLPEDVIGAHDFIQVDPHEAWKDADRTAESVRILSRPGCVVLFSAGMASNLMIHDLWPYLQGEGVTLLDMGAIFDPYVGHYTRKHYRRPRWETEARAKNLAGAAVP